MEPSPFMITLGLSNVLALGALIFRAGKVVSSIERNNQNVGNMRQELHLIAERLTDHGERLASLEARVK